MKKKGLIGIIAVVAIIACVAIINLTTKQEGSEGSKRVEITIRNEDEGTELYSGTLTTDAEFLADLLKEQTAFEVSMEDGEWGAYITSMCDEEQGGGEGPWWTYESENNESCVANGYCDAASNLPINDGDKFIFKLSSNY